MITLAVCGEYIRSMNWMSKWVQVDAEAKGAQMQLDYAYHSGQAVDCLVRKRYDLVLLDLNVPVFPEGYTPMYSPLFPQSQTIFAEFGEKCRDKSMAKPYFQQFPLDKRERLHSLELCDFWQKAEQQFATPPKRMILFDNLGDFPRREAIREMFPWLREHLFSIFEVHDPLKVIWGGIVIEPVFQEHKPVCGKS